MTTSDSRAVAFGTATATTQRPAVIFCADLPPGAPRDLDGVVSYRIANAGNLDDLAGTLLALLSGDFSVWTDGKLLLTKALVERLDRLKIEIRIREHAPPHFHVTAPGIDASFTIEDCALLRGTISGHDRQLVEYWHKTGRPLLIRRWNETRQSNCPVGPIEDVLNAGI